MATPADNLVELPGKSSAPDTDAISDEQFIRELKQLKALRSFLIEQAVLIKPSESGVISFGALNLLRYDRNGRSPTALEWSALENFTQELFRHLTDPLRRRFLYEQIPWWMTQLSVILGIVAILSLLSATIIWGFGSYARILPLYIVWIASLGAIGSIAFVGMNALSVQDDATFDLTNTKLLVLRIALGGLFGVVLTLPFGFHSFIEFLYSLMNGGVAIASSPSDVSSSSSLPVGSVMLLLPFILGFSTSLVIMILNQFVSAIQSFFGKNGPSPPAPSATTGSLLIQNAARSDTSEQAVGNLSIRTT
jgi:hypothetical protein